MNISDILFQQEDFVEPNLVGLKIQPNSCHCDTFLSQIQLPEQCFILCILRDAAVISSSTDPTIHSDDYIVALAIDPAKTPALKAALKITHPTCSLKKGEISDRPVAHQTLAYRGGSHTAFPGFLNRLYI